MFKKKSNLKLKIGSIVLYKDELVRINKLSDDNKMVYVGRRYTWSRVEDIMEYCRLVPIEELTVINK